MSSARCELLVFALAALYGTVIGCRCSEEPTGPRDADSADATPPDARLPDSGVPDGSADARVLPDAIQHYFCNEPFFKLPIDGQSERIIGIAMQSEHIVWSKQQENAPDLFGDISVLDLTTCIERQVTSGSLAGGVSVYAGTVVWDESNVEFDKWGYELFAIDLNTDIQERLTVTSQIELKPKYNGRYLAYRRMETLDDPTSLRLLDLQTGDDTELSPGWTNIESFDINERYVIWVAYTQDPLSTGRDVYYHDLSSGETHHIDATYERYQYWSFLWEDWITIRGTDNHMTRPSHLSLYNLVTQEQRSLLEGDYSVGSGPIDSGLVVWNTSAYSGSTDLFPADMELYDIDTGLTRRLTSHEGLTAPTAIASPYLLIIRRLFLYDRFMNDYYIANLEALGVIDGTGTLIPGAPVINPP
jgi:hypothetical protein